MSREPETAGGAEQFLIAPAQAQARGRARSRVRDDRTAIGPQTDQPLGKPRGQLPYRFQKPHHRPGVSLAIVE
jgi:hypothetical protein